MKASKRRVRRLTYALLAWAMAFAVIPTVTAMAAGSIPVTYTEVDAKSDSAVENANYCPIPRGGGTISKYDAEDESTTPVDVTQNGRSCSFVSANYVYTDPSGKKENEKYNAALRLAKIELIGENVALTPEVSSSMAESQQNVKLTIPLSSLRSETNPQSPYRIDLHYGDSSTFRRIALSLAPQSTGTGDNAQPDINMDGTQLTGARHVFLYRDTSAGGVRFVRNVSIDVPRLHTIEWSSNSSKIEFKQVNDTSFVQTDDNGDVTTDKNGSVVGRTQRQYDIVYQPDVSDANVKLHGVVSTAPLTKVKMRANVGGVSYSILNDIGVAIDKDHGFLNYDTSEWTLASGKANPQGQFRDGMLDPFFYKVTSTQGEQLNPNSNFKDLFARTGIPVVKRLQPKNATTDPGWPDVFYKNGKACEWWSCRTWRDRPFNEYFDNWDKTWHQEVTSPRLLDTTFIAPYPVSSDLKYNGTLPSGVSDRSWFTDSRIVDVQNESDSTWPAADVNWNNSNIPVNQNIAGKDSEVSFYVQFNGLPPKLLAYQNSQARWSYFLGRIMINDEWYAVPFPNFPKTPVTAIPSSQGCYKFNRMTDSMKGNEDSGVFTTVCDTSYTKARRAMFTSPDNPNKEPDTTITDVSSDYFTDDNGREFVYSIIGLPPSTSFDPRSRTVKGEVYVPLKLAESSINIGKNAGARVTVELVNARSQTDMLSDGFSRYTSSGKTTARNYRRAPSPRVGPATQLTNITTSDRGPLGCNAEYGSESIRPYCPRTDLMANQWKTLYKVTVKGMMTKDLNVSMVYDYTQKPVLWNAGSAPASKVEVKESSVFRGHNDFSKAMNWRDRSYSKEDDAICVANGLAAGWNRYGMWDSTHGLKCSTIVAEDMANVQEAGNDGNIHFVLKDGYKDPQLWTYYNRTQWAPCDDSRNNACTFKHKSSGQWWYQWNYADIDALNRDADSGKIPTATATAFKIDADTIKTPLVVLKNSESNAKATDETAADSRVAPDQWRMQNEQNTFAAPTVDKAANYYIKLNGDVPDPQDGKAFTGYKLQGITAAGSVEPLLKNRVFYPGDAIDLRAVGADGQPLVKLSNSSFDAARYAELQLVPTFGAYSSGVPHLYHASNYAKSNGVETFENMAFAFYAAPGLTVNLAKEKYDPANHRLTSHADYEYSSADSTETKLLPNPDPDDPDKKDTLSSEALRFVYGRTDVTVTLKANIKSVTNGVPNLPQTADYSKIQLRTWTGTDPNQLTEQTQTLNPDKQSMSLSKDQLQGMNDLDVKWSWVDQGSSGQPAEHPFYYRVDPWQQVCDGGCLTPASVVQNSNDKAKSTIELVKGSDNVFETRLHTAQVTFLTDGLSQEEIKQAELTVTPERDLKSSEEIETTAAQTVTVPAGDIGVKNESGQTNAITVANTKLVKPKYIYSFAAPKKVNGKMLRSLRVYQAANKVEGNKLNAMEAATDTDSSHWEELNGINKDRHDIYNDEHLVIRAEYFSIPVPSLPRAGGFAETTFLIIGLAILCLGATWVLCNERRRKALEGEIE